MRREDCFLLGRLLKVHGLHGELIARLEVDQPDQYAQLESVLVETPQGLVPFFVQSWQLRGDEVRLRFEDIADADAASVLRGAALWLPLQALAAAPDNTFYYHEVVGLTAFDEALGELGPVETLYELPHQYLMAVRHQGREVLVPMHPDVVLGLDRAAQRVRTRLPEGLLDIYLADEKETPDDAD